MAGPLNRCLESDLWPGNGDKPRFGEGVLYMISIRLTTLVVWEARTTKQLDSCFLSKFKKFVTVGAILYNYSALVDFLYIGERVGTTL